jgi:DNA-binding MarR family transcriptional regulator
VIPDKMNLNKLTEKDILLIELLGKIGSMALPELSAQTLTIPSQILKIIENLQRAGYIDVAPVKEVSENKTYFLNSKGRKLWNALR